MLFWKKYGVGSCGPRGFYGTIDVHLDCDAKISEFLGTPYSILYFCGLATTANAIPAFAKQGDLIITMKVCIDADVCSNVLTCNDTILCSDSVHRMLDAELNAKRRQKLNSSKGFSIPSSCLWFVEEESNRFMNSPIAVTERSIHVVAVAFEHPSLSIRGREIFAVVRGVLVLASEIPWRICGGRGVVKAEQESPNREFSVAFDPDQGKHRAHKRGLKPVTVKLRL
eukprot:Gb_39791 [translate_table: standard]